jgi:crossover junction endonuclease MUS81
MWLFNVIIAAHLILLATVKCTCTEKSKSVLQDHVLQEIMVISKTNLLYRKFRDTLRILCSKGLIWQEGDTMGLTDSGRLLGGMLFEESRIDYPDIETCMQECLLDQLNELFTDVTSPTPSSPKQVQSAYSSSTPQVSLSLPRLIWPLSVQPSNLRFGEHIGERKDDDSPLPDFTPIPGVEKDWEVVMLLDTREVRTLQDRSFLHNQLHQVGVMCEKRPLALGDMQWILRHTSTNREIMLTTIVERKNTRDLAQSIIDGRFNEQQYRLLQCGCRHPVYLIEGDVRSQDVMSGESLQSGIVTTFICRDLYVYMSTSIDDTVVFLKGLHDQVIASVHRYFESGDTYKSNLE